MWLPDELTLGGPRPVDATRPAADLPLFADLSRIHAAIHRHPEHYTLHGRGPAGINGGDAVDEALLRHEDEITLGEDVRLRFEIPSPLSRSARLTLVSGHRPAERNDGLILMAETCLLGPTSDQHIVCPEAAAPLVLFRKEGRLWCRSPEEWKLQGRSQTAAAPLPQGALVTTETLSFRVELR